tara:strand:- start:30343 stop:31341 length:999 start_codon:yes stop_codon:yes gene_type:complete
MNKIIKIKTLIVGVFLLGLTFLGSAAKSNETKQIAVSVIQVVEHPALDATRKGILDELKEQGYSPENNLKWSFETAQNSPLLASQISQKFAFDKPDVIVAIGTLAGQSALRPARTQDIPVVFSSVTDPLGAQLVSSLERPAGNVTGVSNLIPVVPQFELFREILPQLKRIGMVYNPGEINSVKMVELCQAAANELGIELITAMAEKSIDVNAAAHHLTAEGVDALFVSNDNTALSAFKTLIKIATENNIPVFCSDTDYVYFGALAALGPNQYLHGRQTGRIIIDILKGKAPTEIPVGFPEKTELFLNQKMAKTLGITLPSKLIQEASTVINY